MIFFLSKILVHLLKPIVWCCILLVFAVFNKKPNKRKPFILAALLILLIFSNGFLVGKAFNFYEPKYPPLKGYDIGVLLGGFSDINQRNNKIAFGSRADRLLQTVALYKSGVIKKILVTSGSADLLDTRIKEADLVKVYLREIGIPDSVILIENQSRNTLENAKFSKTIIDKEDPNASLLVITSAWHLPRAKIIFKKFYKNEIEYYPTNHLGKTEFDLSDFIMPTAEALGNWNLILKEWVGLIVDSWRS